MNKFIEVSRKDDGVKLLFPVSDALYIEDCGDDGCFLVTHRYKKQAYGISVEQSFSCIKALIEFAYKND